MLNVTARSQWVNIAEFQTCKLSGTIPMNEWFPEMYPSFFKFESPPDFLSQINCGSSEKILGSWGLLLKSSDWELFLPFSSLTIPYLKIGEILSQETSLLFCFFLTWKHVSYRTTLTGTIVLHLIIWLLGSNHLQVSCLDNDKRTTAILQLQAVDSDIFWEVCWSWSLRTDDDQDEKQNLGNQGGLVMIICGSDLEEVTWFSWNQQINANQIKKTLSNEPTNSSHIWRKVWESNLGHIGGMQVFSPLCHSCTQQIDQPSNEAAFLHKLCSANCWEAWSRDHSW